jgi:hypothetical protein
MDSGRPEGETEGQERSHGQGEVGRMPRHKDLAVDLKMASHTLGLALDKIADLPPELGRLELLRIIAAVEADIGLVQRTVDGVARRMR